MQLAKYSMGVGDRFGREALSQLRAVMAAQRRVWAAKAKAFVGGKYRALVVAPGVARLESQAPDVDGVTYLTKRPRKPMPKVGEFACVRITAVQGYDFEAVPL